MSYFIWASGEEWKSALFQHGCMQMKRCEKQSKHNQHCIRIHSIHKTTTPQHQSFLSSHTHTLSLFFSDHKSKVWKLRAGLWRMEGRNGVWVTAVKGCCCAMLPWLVHSDETCLPFQQSGVKRVSAESIPGDVIARVMFALSHINRHTHSRKHK